LCACATNSIASRKIEHPSAKQPVNASSMLTRIFAWALNKKNQRKPLVHLSRRFEVAEVSEPNCVEKNVVLPDFREALNAREEIIPFDFVILFVVCR
jgi:hypothetical protein